MKVIELTACQTTVRGFVCLLVIASLAGCTSTVSCKWAYGAARDAAPQVTIDNGTDPCRPSEANAYMIPLKFGDTAAN